MIAMVKVRELQRQLPGPMLIASDAIEAVLVEHLLPTQPRHSLPPQFAGSPAQIPLAVVHPESDAGR